MVRLARAHGALIVDKPSGWTSHDVVAKARGLYGQRRVGHGGTLDPLATGVLILLFGEATKLSPYVAGANKAYEARVEFGFSTSTLDAEGEETARTPLTPDWLTAPQLHAALEVERRRTEQIPPAFSAIKVQGRTAHSLARRGHPLELAPRAVHVAGLELVAATDAAAEFRLSVAKGYYVRSFARDVCATLGVAGHLSALRRTRSGAFLIDVAQPWPLLAAVPLIPLADVARACLPTAELSAEGVTRTRHGKALDDSHFQRLPELELANSPLAWLSEEGRLLAIGQRGDDGSFRVLRGFCEPAIPPLA